MELDLTILVPDVRSFGEMRSVAMDQAWAKNAPDHDLYFMYRGIEEHDTIRYDVTVVPANMLNTEFIKTKGHYHVGKYQEVYTVLEGEAIYFMQKRKEGSENEIEDVYAVKAKKGDVVVIQPNYGHITINPSPTQELKMANWVSSECKSDYSLFEKFQGACYYYTTNGWVKNEKYINTPELRFEEPITEVPTDLTFLKNK